MEKLLSEFQKVIEYDYKDKNLPLLALSHSSYGNEQKIKNNSPNVDTNERLEFLGDAVLELVTSNDIFNKYPDMKEGEMSKYRASIVCEPTLAACAREFGLERFILLGKGEEMTGGRNRDSIISDALEAVIGSIFLDGGLEAAKLFIYRFILDDIEKRRLFYDSKTTLQEVMQSLGKEIIYTDISESGPQHNKIFTVSVEVEEMFNISATGHTKKNAQQNAAYKALIKLKEEGVLPKDRGKNKCF